MRDIGPLSSSRYATLTDTSQATALTDLAELVQAGLVRREGGGRNTRYHFAVPQLGNTPYRLGPPLSAVAAALHRGVHDMASVISPA